jgi:histidinol dehydrogenase
MTAPNPSPIPVIDLTVAEERSRLMRLIDGLRLDARSLLSGHLDETAAKVKAIMADVIARGPDALMEIARHFDDPTFEASQLSVGTDEMARASAALAAERPQAIAAIRRAIAQVREYQSHILPRPIDPLRRAGVELGLRYTPVDSAGLYVPGGKASYPSSLIMLAVPAQVAGVRRIVVCTPAGKFGDNQLLYAAAHELGITEMFRIGGPAAIAVMAGGVAPVDRPVDKIVGPGNTYVQLAKRLVSGAVGVDGYYGPSEIVTIADDSCDPAYVAADLLAQAEHDPGRCFLLTLSRAVADAVAVELARQLPALSRGDAVRRALADGSAIVIAPDPTTLFTLANTLAAEHVNLQVADVDSAMAALRHAGAIFIGPHSPVAAGDYVAGPSHSLPTNTTARFGGGISVYEFLKRTGTVRYTPDGLAADAAAITEMARLEGLDAHARSVTIRQR